MLRTEPFENGMRSLRHPLHRLVEVKYAYLPQVSLDQLVWLPLDRSVCPPNDEKLLVSGSDRLIYEYSLDEGSLSNTYGPFPHYSNAGGHFPSTQLQRGASLLMIREPTYGMRAMENS